MHTYPSVFMLLANAYTGKLVNCNLMDSFDLSGILEFHVDFSRNSYVFAVAYRCKSRGSIPNLVLRKYQSVVDTCS